MKSFEFSSKLGRKVKPMACDKVRRVFGVGEQGGLTIKSRVGRSELMGDDNDEVVFDYVGG